MVTTLAITGLFRTVHHLSYGVIPAARCGAAGTGVESRAPASKVCKRCLAA